MDKKKILKIAVMLLLIVILLVGVALLVNKQVENSNIEKLTNIEKLKKYSETLTEFNCQKAISNKGYISEDEALKIIAISTVSRDNKQIKMKEYLKSIGSIEIELIENNENESNNSVLSSALGNNIKSQGTYWKIILRHNSFSYMEEAEFNVNYYTGEILFGKVTSQIDID